MARKTIVGLYDRRTDAEAVRQELLDAGFDDLNIDVVADGGFGGSNDFHGGIFVLLTGWGVPHDEAHEYSEGVRQGGALVAVSLTRDSAVQRAVSIMDVDGAHSNLGRAATAMRDANASRTETTDTARTDATDSDQPIRTGVYPIPEGAPPPTGERSHGP